MKTRQQKARRAAAGRTPGDGLGRMKNRDDDDPSLLEDSEREALDGPQSVLLSARIELHRATGRANNQLLLQEQDEVADALGYGDADLLMAAVAEAARTVTGIEDAVLHRIHKRGRRRRWLARTRDLGHGILLAEETLTLADDAPSVIRSCR